MTWDLGLDALTLVVVIALGFAVLAGLLVGGSAVERLVAAALTVVGCVGIGLLTSEWIFGWATEEDLQPNVDGLSRDEVLLSSVAGACRKRYSAPRRTASSRTSSWPLISLLIDDRPPTSWTSVTRWCSWSAVVA